jgi:hypothetical protein
MGGPITLSEDAMDTVERMYYDPQLGGTEHCYGFAFVPTRWLFRYTDSVSFHANEFKCWWTLDVIGSYIPKLEKWNKAHGDNNFLVISFDVTDSSCHFAVKEDTDGDEIVHQEIEYTDLPHSIKLYLIDGVLMFPSDY